MWGGGAPNRVGGRGGGVSFHADPTLACERSTPVLKCFGLFP